MKTKQTGSIVVKYLTESSPDAFLGMTRKLRKNYHPRSGRAAVLCPKCKGFGGWHLEVDAYGPGKHFDCSCSQCNGWGWVDRDSLDATCIHNYKEITQAECRRRGVSHFGNCYHVCRCPKCGAITAYDSSD